MGSCWRTRRSRSGRESGMEDARGQEAVVRGGEGRIAGTEATGITIGLGVMSGDIEVEAGTGEETLATIETTETGMGDAEE